MKVDVKLYATLEKHMPKGGSSESLAVNLEEGATVADLFLKLEIPPDEVKAAFVDSVKVSPSYRLSDGQHVGIFPPVGGG